MHSLNRTACGRVIVAYLADFLHCPRSVASQSRFPLCCRASAGTTVSHLLQLVVFGCPVSVLGAGFSRASRTEDSSRACHENTAAPIARHLTAENAEDPDQCLTGLTGFSGLSGPSCYPVEVLACSFESLSRISGALRQVVAFGAARILICLSSVRRSGRHPSGFYQS